MSRSVLSLTCLLLTLPVVSAETPVRAEAQALTSLSYYRSFDGTGNNPFHPTWGAAGTAFQRFAPADYIDGSGMPVGQDLPNPRAISNACAAQSGSIPNDRQASHYVWQWGQFIDHDIALTLIADPGEALHIDVPMADPFFDPDETGVQIIPFMRSNYVMVNGVREQLNQTTSYIDGSMVYGPNEDRARELRTLDGTGRLKTSTGDLLPFNLNGFPNEPTSLDPGLFLAGDVRANEQVGLTALHTLFVREHNYQADCIRNDAPQLPGEDVYQLARAIVVAEIQAITYREFLPMLLGPNALAPYDGFDHEVQPDNANVFAGAAFRVGHTLLPSVLPRIDASGTEIPQGHLALADAFFDPQPILDAGIDPLLRGLGSARAEEIDAVVVDDIRNFLFGDPGQGGLDLAALNLQRGRDHGLPRYNHARRDMGLRPRSSFAEVSSNPQVVARLEAIYDDVNDIDVWLGGLCEDHESGMMVGELFATIITRQFVAFRDGDGFWYQKTLPAEWIGYVEQQDLATIIRRNTAIGSELPDNVFLAPDPITAVNLAAGGELTVGIPYPNPTYGRVSLLTSPSQDSAMATANVFDLRGRRVATPRLVPSAAGEFRLDWSGLNEQGRRVSAGTYLIVVESAGQRASRKVVVVD